MPITIKRPTRTVSLCTDLSLIAEHQRAVDELETAQKRAVGLENTGVPEAASAVEAVEARMREATVVFTLTALPRKVFNEFEASHPPRKDDKTDTALDVNVSELDELIAACITSVRYSGDSESEFPSSDWVGLADQMTDGQWQEFALAALQVNRGTTGIPFSRAASLATQRYEKSLKLQSG